MNELALYFQGLQLTLSQELSTAIEDFQRRTYKKGDFLLREGEVTHTISFIVSGKIRHFYNIDGNEYTRWVSLENYFITAFKSFVRQEPSQENLECIEDCMLLSMNRDKFYALKDHFPEIQQLWISSLEEEMIGYEDRIFQLITTNSEKRYLDFLQKYPLHAREIPQKYIASMLGIAPRHLSRIRKKIADQKK